MSEYQRIRMINGKAYIVDDEGNKLDPESARGIMDALSNTVDEPCYVYLGWSEEKQLHKIGISNDPERRAKEVGMDVLATMKCEMWGDYSARAFEGLLHRVFRYFDEENTGEWFSLDAADIVIIRYFFTCNQTELMKQLNSTVQSLELIKEHSYPLDPIPYVMWIAQGAWQKAGLLYAADVYFHFVQAVVQMDDLNELRSLDSCIEVWGSFEKVLTGAMKLKLQ